MMTCWDSRRELLVIIIADRPATLDEADIIPMAFGHPAVRVQSVFTGAIMYNYFYLLVIRHDQSPALCIMHLVHELAPLVKSIIDK